MLLVNEKNCSEVKNTSDLISHDLYWLYKYGWKNILIQTSTCGLIGGVCLVFPAKVL